MLTVAANKTTELLGDKAEYLMTHKCKISKKDIHLPGPDFLDRVWINSDRNPQVLRNLQQMYNNGRLSENWLFIYPSG
jgi:class I fructose-bisphosphate aldolase